MKLRIILGICSVLCIFPSICLGQSKTTIDECIATAMAHNRALLLSEQNARNASGKVTEAKGADNLKFSVFGNASDRSDEESLPLAVGIDSNQKLIFKDVPLVPNSRSSVGLSVNKIIDVSGMIRTGINAAKVNAISAGLNISSTRNDTVLQTKLAYYDVLRAEELLGVSQEAMKNAETRKKTAQALVDAGISSKVDVIRADAAILAAQQSIIGAQNAIEMAKSVLNRIMGVDVNSALDVVKPAEADFKLGVYEDYLNEALAKRPEVDIAAKNMDISRLRYKLAQNGMLPSVVLSATTQIDSTYKTPQDKSSSIGVSVIFPLSDGGETNGRKEQAKAGIESARVAEEDIKSAVALQVKTAYVHVQNAAEKLATANKELEQSTESLRLSRYRYSEGMSSQVELSDAELYFTQAQTNVVNARYDQLSSQAELDRAIGRYAQ